MKKLVICVLVTTPADGADPLYLHLRRPHSDGIRTAVCIKNGEFAGKKTI